MRYCIFDLIFSYVGKLLDSKALFNFKIYEASDLATNNYNTNIAQYLEKQRRPDKKKIEKSYTKREGEDSPRHFHKNSKLNISLDQQSKLI